MTGLGLVNAALRREGRDVRQSRKRGLSDLLGVGRRTGGQDRRYSDIAPPHLAGDIQSACRDTHLNSKIDFQKQEHNTRLNAIVKITMLGNPVIQEVRSNKILK